MAYVYDLSRLGSFGGVALMGKAGPALSDSPHGRRGGRRALRKIVEFIGELDAGLGPIDEDCAPSDCGDLRLIGAKAIIPGPFPEHAITTLPFVQARHPVAVIVVRRGVEFIHGACRLPVALGQRALQVRDDHFDPITERIRLGYRELGDDCAQACRGRQRDTVSRPPGKCAVAPRNV